MQPLLLEIFVVSALLFAGYAWLMERRVDFRWCRHYLSWLPLLAVAIPLLEIPLWPGRVVELASVGELQGSVALPSEESAEVALFGWMEGLWLLYALGVLLLVGLMFYQVWKIRRLERGAEIGCWEGIRVVRTPKGVASFSFFGTVYLSETTTAEEMAVILKHEQSHIRHHHSHERLWMELWKALLWWNPFIWLAARRLAEVEEFEADRDVLRSGENTNNYIQTIFKQLFGYSPDIANSLRDSLTKKRFKMMTQKTMSRYARLRMAATLSLVVALVVAFGTTARATQFIEAPQPQEQPVPQQQEQVMLSADKMPSFQGGTLQDFQIWVAKNMKYPEEAVKGKISGMVVLSFEIQTDGSVGEVKVLQSPSPLLSDEAVRVVSSSPAWTPAEQKGQKVVVRFTMPVQFAL